MITGFNTDIEHGGTTYHVQTEDKGLDTPIILSLVYVGGAILASKRAPYDDLIAAGFNEGTLTERLQRQHKLICAAIKAGRVEDLKRIGQQDAPEATKKAGRKESARRAETPEAKAPPAPAPQPTEAPAARAEAPPSPAPSAPAQAEAPAPQPSAPAPAAPSILDLLTEVNVPIVPQEGIVRRPTFETPPRPEPQPPTYEAEIAILPEHKDDGFQGLYLTLLDDEGEFRAGQFATIKIYAGRGRYGRHAVGNADITVKVLGTTFRPLLLSTKTNEDGVAVVRAILPRFTSGRAALLIRAVTSDGDVAELRRIIHQA